jgi:hypothetical protein
LHSFAFVCIRWSLRHPMSMAAIDRWVLSKAVAASLFV